jgi:concanavalin A-like lectin/glucanase superfamily protein/galactose oxidase-like protein/Big-like domain-containing protein
VAVSTCSRAVRKYQWLVLPAAALLLAGSLERTADARGRGTEPDSGGQAAPSPGLVLALGFDENTGSTATDASGLGNHGVVNGATWTAAGRFGAALTFDGINDWVTVPDAASLDLTNRLTIEAWVYPTALNSWDTVVLKEAGFTLAYALYGNDENQRPGGWVRIGGADRSALGTAPLPINTWSHLAMTYDGAQLKLFLNGNQVRSVNRNGSIAASTGPLRLGGNAVWTEFFDGRLDEVRIYNRALTAAEIQTDMKTPLGAPDVTPPTASITSPSDGATVAGVVTVTANVSDDRSVAGVQLVVDGLPSGAEDLVAPFQFTWDTRSMPNGSHTLSVLARDGAGNQGGSPLITTTVVNLPRLQITQPIDGTTIRSTLVNIAYTVLGDSSGVGVDHVHFQVDGGPEIMDTTFDGQFEIDGVAAGPHTLDGFLVRANHSKIAGTDAARVSFTVVPPDTVAPTVTVTAPAADAIVSGSVSIEAAAADNVGVIGVQFFIDGTPLGAEDTLAPYAASWNTTSLVNGAHTITARARDAAENATMHSVTVTLANVTGPARFGQWSAPFDLNIVAVHLSLMKTGKILLWDGPSTGGINTRVWDPGTGSIVLAPNGQTNLFCAGHVALSDGTILTLGGDDSPTGNTGTADVGAFDPVTGTWTPRMSMARRRWYPTGTVLPDGRVVVMSGSSTCYTCHVMEHELYDPKSDTWTTLPASADYLMPLYPLNFVLSDGTILNVGSTEGALPTRALNLSTSTWTTIDPEVIDAQSAVLYGPDKLMKTGKTASGDPPIVPSHGRTYVLDLTQPGAVWRETAAMHHPRTFHVLTLLPDGTTLVTGGGRTNDLNDDSVGVLEPEIWNPTTETWTLMGPAQIPRLYHGSAILLPDARVLVAGSGAWTGTNQTRGEIFSPPYLFKGPRPVISSAPELLRRGTPFLVDTPDAASVAGVSLIRVGTMTHSFNPDQRFLRLEFSQNGGGISATLPANSNLTPPGYYLLFLLSSEGVPSVGRFVRIAGTNEDFEAPTAPDSLQASGGIGTIALTWNPASDDVAVTAYNIHRATAPGFTPGPANRVAQTTGTTYVDSLPAGTYYYRVTAQDAAQNLSPASNEATATALADTTAPTVEVTAPGAGSTVSGVVTLSATATDNASVVGVQFLVDGVPIGAEDTAAPYSVAWLSSTVANGSHLVSARARDGSGNTASADISVTVSNAVPTGLVLALGFDENSGPSVTDASGLANHGTVNGATWTAAGRFGSALTFDGVNDWVTVPDAASLDLTNRLTIEAWVYPTALNSWDTIVLKEAGSTLAYALYGNDDTQRPGGWVRISGGDWGALGAAALPINTWTHLAMTYDGAQLKLFVNGNEVRSVARTGSMGASTGPLRMGGNAVWTEFFDGRLDEIRIYNRALTAAEIQTDMVSPISR